MKLFTIALAAAATFVSTAPAQALTYAFAFTAGADSGSGFLTTAGVPASPITGVTGTINGFAITGLSGYAAADNILYASPWFSIGGVSLIANTIIYNLYFANSYQLINSVTNPTGGGIGVEMDVTVTQVPEPASWALMIAGFGMVGVATRRRQAALAA